MTNIEVLTGSGWSTLPDWLNEAGPGLKVKLAGVNLAGAEFGQQNVPGTYGTDYIYPSATDIDIYINDHMNVIRLAFRWERLQRTLGSDFDAEKLSHLKSTVDYAVSKGISVF
jgi:endoglucanase